MYEGGTGVGYGSPSSFKLQPHPNPFLSLSNLPTCFTHFLSAKNTYVPCVPEWPPCFNTSLPYYCMSNCRKGFNHFRPLQYQTFPSCFVLSCLT